MLKLYKFINKPKELHILLLLLFSLLSTHGKTKLLLLNVQIMSAYLITKTLRIFENKSHHFKSKLCNTQIKVKPKLKLLNCTNDSVKKFAAVFCDNHSIKDTNISDHMINRTSVFAWLNTRIGLTTGYLENAINCKMISFTFSRSLISAFSS